MVNPQQIYDGYPSLYNEQRQLRKSNLSYIKFRNNLEMGSVYLSSYSFEMYLKLITYDSKSNRTFQGTVFNCGSHSLVNISFTSITFWQSGGDVCSYTFKTNEFVSYLGDWMHLAFSYNNYSQASNKIMYQRIFINGIQVQTCRVYNPSKVDSKIGKGICYIGNMQNSQTYNSTLNADIAYFITSDNQITSNFDDDIYRKYPSPDKTGTIYYFRLDTANFSTVDYYYNRAVSDFQIFKTDYKLVNEMRQICECYGQPMNVFSMVRSTSSSQSFQMRSTDDLSKGFVFDFWINIRSNLEDNTNHDLFILDKVIKIRNYNRNLQVSVGDTSSYNTIGSSNLYYRKWMYFAISVSNSSQVQVFRNGIKVQSWANSNSIKNGQNFTLKHQTTLYLYRFRLFTYSPSFTNQFFNLTYLQGSNSEYSDKLSFSSGLTVFDFMLTDINLKTYTYKTGDMVDGIYQSNGYTLSLSNAQFVFDQTTCGADPSFIDGACNDNYWYQRFSNEKPTKVFSNSILSVNNAMTIELWFKSKKPNSVRNSYVIMVAQPSSTSRERLKIDMNFSDISSLHSIGAVCYDTANRQLKFEDMINEDFWYHIAFRTEQSSNRSSLVLYNPLIKQESSASSGSCINSITKPYSNTYLGNSPSLDKPYIGFIRELRFWHEYRTDENIFIYRNIEVPSTIWGTILTHYYRFIGDTQLMRITQANLTNYDYDLVLYNAKQVESPTKFFQDTDLLICPYGKFLSVGYCAYPKQVNSQLVVYFKYDEDLIIINSQVKFPEGQEELYSIRYILFSTDPYLQTHINEKQPIFNQSDVLQYNISTYKLSTSYKYQVQIRLRSKFYPSSFADQFQYVWIDFSCPKFTFSKINPNDNTIYIYNKGGNFNYTYSVDMVPTVSCLSQTYIQSSSLKYSWPVVNNTVQNFTEVNKSIGMSLSSNGQSLKVWNKKPLSEGYEVQLNVTLSFTNLLLSSIQQYYNLVRLKFSQVSVVMIFDNPTQQLYSGQALSINAASSFVIHPDYPGRAVTFQAICPSRLFKSTADYNKYCFMDYLGRFSIPASQLSNMNIVPFITYTFQFEGHIKLSEEYYTVGNVNVTWVTLSSLTNSNQCPNVTFPSYVNISKIDTYSQIFPKYELNCQRSGYIAVYQIESVEWLLDVSGVSYYKTLNVVNNSTPSSSSSQNQTTIESNATSNITNGTANNTNLNSNISIVQQRITLISSNWNNISSQDSIFTFNDYQLWAVLTDSARAFLQVGEVIPITITYTFSTNEFKQPYVLQRQTKLIVIATDMVLGIASNNQNFTYSLDDQMWFNASKTYDPENPSVNLNINWICPSITKSYCPTLTSFYNITLEQRILMQWKYNFNYTMQILARNSKNQKYSNLYFPFLLLKPQITQEVSVCPYFDFSLTNQNMWKDQNDSYVLYFSNNITNYVIQQPYTKLICGNTTALQYSLVALQLMDESSVFQEPYASKFMHDFSSSGNLSISSTKITSLDKDKNYTLTAYLYYRQSKTSNEIKYYSKNIVIRQSFKYDVLVAQFNSSYIQVKANESLIIDAGQSYDSENVSNKNFNYSWECPIELQNYSNICPNSSTNVSKISLNQTFRSRIGMNTPGRLYRFKVLISDQNRSSEVATTTIFIQPINSTNNDCMTLNLIDTLLTTQISQDFVYPLIQSFEILKYCDNLTIDTYAYKVQYDESNADGPEIKLKAFTGFENTLMSIRYTPQITITRSYQILYQISYFVLSDYYQSVTYLTNLTFQKYQSPIVSTLYYIDGPSVYNLQTSNILTLTFLPSYYDSGNKTISMIWKCDSRMQMNQVCGSFKNNTFTLKYSDFGIAAYTNTISEKVFRIDAIYNGNTYSKYLQFTLVDQYSFPSDCRIVPNQYLYPYINITKSISFSLMCSEDDKSLITNYGMSYLWNITNGIQNEYLLSQSDSIIRFKPFAFSQYKTYFINMTLKNPQNPLKNLTIVYSLNTNPGSFSSSIQQGSTFFSPTYGFFYETYFNLTLSGWGTSVLQSKLNLFVSLRIYDGNYWVTMIPIRLLNSSSIGPFSIPRYQKLILDFRNNRGEVKSIEFSSLDIYTNKNMNDSNLIKMKQDVIRNMSSDKNDTVMLLNEMYQYCQILLRLSTDLQQSSYLDFYEIMIEKLNETLRFIDKNYDKYCYVEETCIRIQQTQLLIFYNIITINQKYMIENQTELARQLLLNLITYDDTFNLDLNQNLHTLTAELIQILNFTNEQSSPIIDKINKYKKSNIAPGESLVIENNTTYQIVQPIVNQYDQYFSAKGYSVTLTENTIANIINSSLSNTSIGQSNFGILRTEVEYIKTSMFQIKNITYLTEYVLDVNTYSNDDNQMSISNISNPVNLQFTLSQEKQKYWNRAMCVYLDEINYNWTVLENSGIQINGNQASCKAYHLTKFTIIYNGTLGITDIIQPTLLIPFSQEENQTFSIIMVVIAMGYGFAQLFSIYINHHQQKQIKSIIQKNTEKAERGEENDELTEIEEYSSENRARVMCQSRFKEVVSVKKRAIFKMVLLFNHSFTSLIFKLKEVQFIIRIQIWFTSVFAISFFSILYFMLREGEKGFKSEHLNYEDSIVVAIILELIFHVPIQRLTNYLYSRFKLKKNEGVAVLGREQRYQMNIIETLNLDYIDSKGQFQNQDRQQDNKFLQSKQKREKGFLKNQLSNDLELEGKLNTSKEIRKSKLWKNQKKSRFSSIRSKGGFNGNQTDLRFTDIIQPDNQFFDVALDQNQKDDFEDFDSQEFKEYLQSNDAPRPSSKIKKVLTKPMSSRNQSNRGEVDQDITGLPPRIMYHLDTPSEVSYASNTSVPGGADQPIGQNGPIQDTAVANASHIQNTQHYHATDVDIQLNKEKAEFELNKKKLSRDLKIFRVYISFHIILNSCILGSILYLLSRISQKHLIYLFVSLIISSVLSFITSALISLKVTCSIMIIDNRAEPLVYTTKLNRFFTSWILGKEKQMIIRRYINKRFVVYKNTKKISSSEIDLRNYINKRYQEQTSPQKDQSSRSHE